MRTHAGSDSRRVAFRARSRSPTIRGFDLLRGGATQLPASHDGVSPLNELAPLKPLFYPKGDRPGRRAILVAIGAMQEKMCSRLSLANLLLFAPSARTASTQSWCRQ